MTDRTREPRTFGRRKGKKLRPGRAERRRTSAAILDLDAEESGILDLSTLFIHQPTGYWLEIGFGAGEHLAWQAAQNPCVGHLGAEVFEAGVARMVDYVAAAGLENVRIIPDDARPYLRRLPAHSLERIHLLFPDPWPKFRHRKRRFIQPPIVDLFAHLMQPGGELRIATDDPAYARWSLDHVTSHPAFTWSAECAADWRTRPPDWPATRYEEKARQAQRHCYFMRFRRLDV